MTDPSSRPPETILSARQAFRSEIAYHVVDADPGAPGPKPLILYLHGFGQNRARFESLCAPMHRVNAYHLHVDGLYPVYERPPKREHAQWGRAWYLYDGSRQRLRSSLEVASEFLQELVEPLYRILTPNRLCVLGYSMGGYLAGYFALTRWKHVSELIAVGCRIQHEVVSDDGWSNLRHLRVLALHGERDTIVSHEPQREAVQALHSQGLDATLRLLPSGHAFDETITDASLQWLNEKGYAIGAEREG